MKNTHKVLIIATSRTTRGGITSVVKTYERGEQWSKYYCKWLETHVDKNWFLKFNYFLKSFIQYLFLLPRYDIVHIHTSEPSSAIRKVPFMWYARLLRKKVIIHFHSFSIETTINSKLKFIYKYLFLNADVVLVLSEYWKQEITKTFQLNSKVKVLYNPCCEPDYSFKCKKEKQILFAGTLNVRKGYQDLIKAFAKIAKDYPEWKIVFAGNGEIEQGQMLAKELNIENQTVFLGWVSGQAKSNAFQEATVFCLPSYAEGFPMAVLDAWAYGLPVITTPVGGLPDILIDGKNALVFSPGDSNALAGLIKKIIDDKLLRDNIANESINLAKNQFNKAVINAQLGEIYYKLLVD